MQYCPRTRIYDTCPDILAHLRERYYLQTRWKFSWNNILEPPRKPYVCSVFPIQ